MSMLDKQEYVEDVMRELRECVTAAQLDIIGAVIRDKLNGYELTKDQSEGMDPGSSDALDAFLYAKSIEGRGASTLKRYRYELTRMLNGINVTVYHCNVNHLRRYLAQRKEGGCSDSTLESLRSIMRAFFGWIHKEGMIQRDPTANLGAVKVGKVERLPFSVTDMERMREACNTTRDRAIIEFLYSTGCRISEVTALDRSDIDMHSREVRVIGKGNKERVVYLSDICVMLLRRYFLERGDQSQALFAGRGSDRMTAQGMRHMLDGIQERSGVEDVHPHRFRRTLATNLIAHGMNIQEVAMILGHENIDTTMVYVHTSQVTVKQAYMRVIS